MEPGPQGDFFGAGLGASIALKLHCGLLCNGLCNCQSSPKLFDLSPAEALEPASTLGD
jgi:hypothetical protein